MKANLNKSIKKRNKSRNRLEHESKKAITLNNTPTCVRRYYYDKINKNLPQNTTVNKPSYTVEYLINNKLKLRA